MQFELKKAPRSYQELMVGRVTQYKGDIASLRRQVNGGISTREELFSKQGGSDPFEVTVNIVLSPTYTHKHAHTHTHTHTHTV